MNSSLEYGSEVSGIVLFEEHIIKMAAGCMFCSSNLAASASHAINEGNEKENRLSHDSLTATGDTHLIGLCPRLLIATNTHDCDKWGPQWREKELKFL